jgi:hypothetical protein
MANRIVHTIVNHHPLRAIITSVAVVTVHDANIVAATVRLDTVYRLHKAVHIVRRIVHRLN